MPTRPTLPIQTNAQGTRLELTSSVALEPGLQVRTGAEPCEVQSVGGEVNLFIEAFTSVRLDGERPISDALIHLSAGSIRIRYFRTVMPSGLQVQVASHHFSFREGPVEAEINADGAANLFLGFIDVTNLETGDTITMAPGESLRW